MSYPVHPNVEPPFPEVWPCPWCGAAKGHDLTKHIDPSLGTPVDAPCSTRAEGKDA